MKIITVKPIIIETHEGWLYLAVVVGLFSRKVIGWSMQPRMTKGIVLNALLMAVWRRNPQKQVLAHSDQGSHGYGCGAAYGAV